MEVLMPTEEQAIAESMPGVIELAGIIHDAADGGTSEEYCSWTMANRAAEAIHARLRTVK
jgi:hypothetical protein